MIAFNGPGMGPGTLSRLSSAQTRSISPENPTGAPGQGGQATTGTGERAARDLGQGWKVSPSIVVAAGGEATLGAIRGAGAIQHLWITTHPIGWRRLILRMYWDDDPQPAVAVPLGDFFCNGWGVYAPVVSLPVAVNPYGGFNCYWEMPFRQGATITLENLGSEDAVVYFQIAYTLTDVPPDTGYFHAQWRRSNPLPYQTAHTVLDGVRGDGHYVGTYLAWGVHNNGWWGEGEVKMYLDDDDAWPTICGTGTEDYFGGAWNFDVPGHGYTPYSTAFLGLPQVIRPDGLYQSQQRFGMYRWHIMDPIRFQSALRMTIQALGWRSGGRYLPLQDDLASTAFWYQRETGSPPGTPFSADVLEVV